MGCGTQIVQLEEAVEEEDMMEEPQLPEQAQMKQTTLITALQTKDFSSLFTKTSKALTKLIANLEAPPRPDYQQIDPNKLQELARNPDRRFKPPRLRPAPLKYSVGTKLIRQVNGCAVLRAVEHCSGALLEAHVLNLDCNQQLLDSVSQDVIFSTNLRHAGICGVFDVRLSGSVLQIFREAAGEQLSKIIREYKGLQEATTRKITKALIQALFHLHQTEVAVNNLSVASVLYQETAKLFGFGAAKRRSQTKRPRCQFYSLSTAESSKRADMYALGSTVMQCLTTRPTNFQFKEPGSLLYYYRRGCTGCGCEYLVNLSKAGIEFIECLLDTTNNMAALSQNKWLDELQAEQLDVLQPNNEQIEYTYKGTDDEQCAYYQQNVFAPEHSREDAQVEDLKGNDLGAIDVDEKFVIKVAK